MKKEQELKDINHEERIRKMHELSNSIDPSLIDMSDERTRYIMSKY